MQTATFETERKSHDLSICVHHYTLRAPCPEGQGNSLVTQNFADVEPADARTSLPLDRAFQAFSVRFVLATGFPTEAA